MEEQNERLSILAQTLPDTSLTHRRLSYPLQGCVPQSLAPFHRAGGVYP